MGHYYRNGKAVSMLMFMKELPFYLEQAITRDLQIRCSPFVHQVIDAISEDVEGNGRQSRQFV